MSTVFSRILSLFLSFVFSVAGTFGGVQNFGKPYAPESADDLSLYAVVVSDLHVNNTITHARNFKLMKLFSGVGKSEVQPDALIMPGDLTERAQMREYAILSTLLRDTPAKQILPAMGNHDARGVMTKSDYPQNLQNYCDFCSSIGVQTDKPYWSTVINGYTFIVLGSEDEVKDCAYISPSQLLWLYLTLAEARESGNPAFVICHQPLAHTNNVDKSWPVAGTIGEQSDAVESILRRYAEGGLPIVYFSGHLHDEFSTYSFENPVRNLYLVNLPSAQYNGNGDGLVLEAYADRILLRTRSFITGEWLADTYEIPLIVG